MTMSDSPEFRTFFMGGFECSTHRRRDGHRLDVIAATRHDQLARGDYELLQRHGIGTVRDGMRWHLIEQADGSYGWSSLLPMLEAAEASGTQVLWDLLHYGWPDHLDIWTPRFVDHFARFARHAARLVREHSDEAPWYVPVNEISFMAWAAGDVAILHPCERGRGDELKRQLARCAIAAVEEISAVDRRARFVHVDPMIRVIGREGDPASLARAAHHTESQFDAFDIIAGRKRPELGGRAEYLDVIGLNYYCHNQWYEGGPPVPWNAGHPDYLPPREMLRTVTERYGRPMIIAETGIEAELRPSWLAHVCDEVHAAMEEGVQVHGLCLYPVLNHPGWDDDRHCPNGLIDYSRAGFGRFVYTPLARELARQQERFAGPAVLPRRRLPEMARRWA